MTPPPRRRPEPGPDEPAPFDCQSCGACCYVSEPMLDTIRRDYVYVMPADRLSHVKHRSLLRKIGSYAGGRTWYLKVTNDDEPRCQQLEGGLGKSVSCAIYNMRPQTCRWFRSGSVQCVSARAFKGQPVPDDYIPFEQDLKAS